MILKFLLQLGLIWAIVGALVYFLIKTEPGRSIVIGAGVLCSILLLIYTFNLWF